MEANSEAQELWEQKADGYKQIDEILYHQRLLFVPKAIQIELISHYYNNSLSAHFGIEMIWKLWTQKYYCPTLRHGVKAYVKGCNVCLAFKAVCDNPHGDLQSLPILTHRWKNLLINFVTGLSLLID